MRQDVLCDAENFHEAEEDAPRPSFDQAEPIDLIDVARVAQRGDGAVREGWLKVIAPAKVNLFLDVGARREDGYHEVESIMHVLNLHDVLYLRRSDELPGSGLAIEVECRTFGGIQPLAVSTEDNLVSRAFRLLAERCGRMADEKLRVIIEKHIPAQAGLGGGSSDAAAALVGAARLWGIASDDPRVEEAARSLGADVAFFLRGGCARFTGAGESFARSLVPLGTPVVLVKPHGGVSTVEAYRAFDEDPQPVPSAKRAAALAASHAADVPLCNNLTKAAQLLLPELSEVHAWIAGQDGVEGSLMSGSGSAVFAVCRDVASACNLAAASRTRGWWARMTSFGSARAALGPSVARF